MSLVIHSDHIEVHDQHGRPMVEVAASLDGFYLRQETPGMGQADVIEVSLAQAYDLLLAISKVLEIPVKVNGYETPF
jgi:hypothetical protein